MISLMNMSDCSCCAEKYNKSYRSPVSCGFCSFTACKECTRRYIIESDNNIHCMSCRKPWDRKFMIENLDRTFVDKEYKEKQKTFLYQMEKERFEETQIVIEQLKENEKVEERISEIKNQISLLYQQIDILKQKTSLENIERKKFIKRCTVDGCLGFLSQQWKCGLCGQYTCKECHEPIKEVDEHKCDPSTIETIKTLQKETKPCPSCGTNIFKIDGCFAENTPILLYDGKIRMSQHIEMGDILMGDDMTPRYVEDTCDGSDEMFLIKQNNGMDYIVNSKHKLVLVDDEKRVFEIKVDDYVANQENILNRGIRTRRGYTNITVISLGLGQYYGWKVSGRNKRFLLSDYTVVRNCDQMFCTSCKTAFSWKTGKKETGLIHNPHFFEWMRNNRQMDRVNEIAQCGRIIDHHFLVSLGNFLREQSFVRFGTPLNLSFELKLNRWYDFYINCGRNIIHLREVEVPRYEPRFRDQNMELRLQLMRNQITEEYFKKQVHIRFKQNEKKRDIYNVLMTIVTCGTDILFKLDNTLIKTNEKAKMKTALLLAKEEMKQLGIYTTECLKQISIVYKSKRLMITEDLNIYYGN